MVTADHLVKERQKLQGILVAEHFAATKLGKWAETSLLWKNIYKKTTSSNTLQGKRWEQLAVYGIAFQKICSSLKQYETIPGFSLPSQQCASQLLF